MSTGYSEAALQEADAAIKASQSYQAPEGERRLNALGNVVSKVSNSSFVSAAQSDAASQVYTVVKDQVSNFAHHSKVLMDVLDKVAKAHPFIQLAASLFEAGLTLELTRRENDAKVIALNLTMCDMMETLTLLDEVVNTKAPGPDGLSTEDRLKQRLGSIIESIKQCAKVCDSYQKRPTVVKFFTSMKWQSKFTEVAQQFADHKAGIQFDLQIHASVGITTANVTLTAMNTSFTALNENVSKLMEVVFERMRSPEERSLSALVSKEQGGLDALLEDDQLLEQVLEEQKAGAGEDEDDNGVEPLVPGQAPGAVLTVVELRKEVNKEVEEVLAANEFFDQKFEAMKMQVEEVRTVIKHESDRVINAILAGLAGLGGPQERIVDRDLHHVWKEMGWKGSVKAKHLVMALRDHFAEGSHAELAAIQVVTQESKDNSTPNAAVQATTEIKDIANRANPLAAPEDEWALQFITVLRIQPLIEALDVDFSSFVTVAEANAFTAARPQNWSLPHWIAYWTYGFEMTVQWYFRRIRKTIAQIADAMVNALPANRRIISSFISSPHVRWVENFLSGLRDVKQWDNTDWESGMFLKFKEYVVENEQKMERNLRSVRYFIDEANTLSVVVGFGRPEKYIMPLIVLLFRRSLHVIQQAHSVTLNLGELRGIQRSLSVLIEAIRDRVRTLKAVHILQNLDSKEQMGRVFYGLYSFAFEKAVFSDYWRRAPETDARLLWGDVNATTLTINEDSGSQSQARELPLICGPATEDIDLIPDPIFDHRTSSLTTAAHSLVGHWSGSYDYGGLGGDGFMSFTVSSHDEEGAIAGSGTDMFGPFSVHGTVSDNRLTFVKEYLSLYFGQKVAWRYEGVVVPQSDEIRGQWGPLNTGWKLTVAEGEAEQGDATDAHASGVVSAQHPYAKGSIAPSSTEVLEILMDEAEDSGAEAVEEDYDDGVSDGRALIAEMTANLNLAHGNFFLKRRPVEYLLARPPDEEFAENRARALWKLALKATLRSVQSKSLNCGRLSARRMQRLRYIELSMHGPVFGLVPEFTAEAEWAQLIQEIHPDDLHLWRCIALYQMRRDIMHEGVSCAACGECPITPTRFLCVNCSQDEVDGGIDLCFKCFSANKHVIRDNKVHHPAHNMVQFRTVKWRVYCHRYINAAKRMLTRAENQVKLSAARAMVQTTVGDMGPPGLPCIICKNYVTAPPYWCCVECIENTLVCYACNERVQREKEWLFQRRPHATQGQGGHDWSHILVSAPRPELSAPETDGEQALTLEERVSRLEARLSATLDRILGILSNRSGESGET